MTTRYPTPLALALAAGLLASPLALAQGANAPIRGPMSFAAFDVDGNGVVTQNEFDRIRAERMAARARSGAPMRGVVDAPSFQDFDLNGDGHMTADEFARAQQSRMRGRPGQWMGPGTGMGPGAGRGPGGGMGRGWGMNQPAFSAFDLDGNGVLTEREFQEARAKRIAERSRLGYPMRNLPNAPAFGAIDLDGNGLIDAREFSAAQSRHWRPGFQTPPAAGWRPTP